MMPSSEEQLIALLCAVGQRRHRAEAEIAARLAESDPTRLIFHASAHGILPLVAHRILEGTAAASLPPSFRAQLERDRDDALRHGLALEGFAATLADRLEDGGIPALLVKGPGLARQLYGEPGLRSATDVDVLLRKEDLQTAGTVTAGLGYRPAVEWIYDGLPLLHRRMLHEAPGMPPVELHWRLHWYEGAFGDRMLERSAGAGAARIAQPADLLASLLLFYARDGLVGLRRAADLAAWWDAYGENADHPVAAQVQRDHPALSPALVTAARAAARLVGVPAEALVSVPRWRGVRRATALRLQNWSGTGEPDQTASDIILIGALLAPRHALGGWLSRMVFPSRGRLDRWYRFGEEARFRLAFWRVAHPVKLTARFVLSFLRAYGSSRRRQLGTWSTVV
jgi:hypothetical protein